MSFGILRRLIRYEAWTGRSQEKDDEHDRNGNVELEIVRVADAPGVRHLTYRVIE
jgi:hypothetical protein